MTVTCTRRLQFCAGHRLLNHGGKCSHMHGHNYVAYLEAESIHSDVELDSVGRVVDFSVLKSVYGTWIDEHWDHGFVLFKEDSEAIRLLQDFETGAHKQKLFLLDSNPTAENLAAFLLNNVEFVQALAKYGVRVTSVTLRETENCSAKVIK
jgi:6-pyruvoyltetrahydropterin/6-carboxytetrahydropterin synthase